MKSMSDDIVSAARVEALEKSQADLAASHQTTLKTVRNVAIGLGVAIVLLAGALLAHVLY